MSASIDQRSKGQSNQVVNGPGGKPVKEEEFEAYLQPQHQGAYGPGPMSSPGDPYMSSYYNPSVTFPYLGQGTIGDGGAWSSGGDAMFSVGSYDYSGMFNFAYPQFGWDFPGSEYWTTPAQQQQPPQQQQQPGGRKDNRMDYADYYRADALPPMDGYGAPMNGELDREMPVGMNKIEQGLKGMTIMDKKQQMDAGVIPLDHQDHNIHGHGHPHAHLGNGEVGHLGQLPNNPVVSQAPKKTSWAAIASQPARAQPQMKSRTIPRAPVNPSKHGMDIGTWDNKNNMGGKPGGGPVPLTGGGRQAPWGAPRGRTVTAGPYSTSGPHSMGGPGGQPPLNPMNGPPVTNVYMNRGSGGGAQLMDNDEDIMAPHDPIADKFSSSVNPKDFNLNPRGARFFIIKSYSEDDIHRSIKYSIWCSTEHGNKRLDGAYKEREGKGPVFLFFSVNGSGHFCGMAQMMSNVDYGSSSAHWAQDKWKGQFHVKWVYVKDVPNSQLRHIRLENNENKPVTNSRDTQEVPPEKGKQVLKIMHSYRNATSIFDDFNHYEIRQQEDQTIRMDPPPQSGRGGRGDGRDNSRDGHDGGRDNRDNGRDRDGGGRDNRDSGRDNRVDGRGDGGRGDGRDGRSGGGRQN